MLGWEGGDHDEMIRGVLFDLDETLLDRTRSLNRFLHGQYARFQTAFQHVAPETFQQRFCELDQRGYVHKSQVYSTLLTEWKIKGLTTEQLLADYRTSFSDHVEGNACWRTVLIELRKRGYQIGIITNGETAFQMANMRTMGMYSLVDHILISEQEQVRKPDPMLFQRGAQRLALSEEECLFVGDHPYNDIEGARQVGMKTAWFQNGLDWPADLARADVEIDKLADLLSMLDQTSW